MYTGGFKTLCGKFPIIVPRFRILATFTGRLWKLIALVWQERAEKLFAGQSDESLNSYVWLGAVPWSKTDGK